MTGTPAATQARGVTSAEENFMRSRRSISLLNIKRHGQVVYQSVTGSQTGAVTEIISEKISFSQAR